MTRAFTIPGPQPNTRKPLLTLPPGSCDCHAHVFGPQSRYPYLPDARYIAPDASPEDYVRMLRTIGCERAVLVQPSVYGTDNSAMLDALRSGIFPFRGVAVVDENVTDRELEERLAKLEIDIVLDHFGRSPAAEDTGSASFQTLLRLLSRENCWAKIMGVYFVSEQYPHFADIAPLARAVVECAPDRTVWATDWPHPMGMEKMPNDGDLADLLSDGVPDEGLRKKVLVDNPARLYGF